MMEQTYSHYSVEPLKICGGVPLKSQNKRKRAWCLDRGNGWNMAGIIRRIKQASGDSVLSSELPGAV